MSPCITVADSTKCDHMLLHLNQGFKGNGECSPGSCTAFTYIIVTILVPQRHSSPCMITKTSLDTMLFKKLFEKAARFQGEFWCQILHHSLALVQPYMITLITPQACVSPCATFTSARKYAFHIILQNQCSCKGIKGNDTHISLSSSSGMSPCITNCVATCFLKK